MKRGREGGERGEEKLIKRTRKAENERKERWKYLVRIVTCCIVGADKRQTWVLAVVLR